MFPDGKTLPVVEGGSDDFVIDTNLGVEPAPQNEFSDFAQGILNGIPETDRPIVSKYIKDWDGNVTKKFQSIHEQYAPYKDLGPVEDVQEALNWIGMLNEDPIQFYNLIGQALKENNMFPDDETDDYDTLPEFEGLPPQFVDRFSNLEQRMAKFMDSFEQFQSSTQEEKQIQQIDKLLSEMHTKHGEFDEDWVLMQISRGVSPDDAIKAFQENIVQKYSSQKRPAPTLISGPGSVPSGQADFSKMTKEEKMAYAVQRLQAAQD